MSEQCCHRSEAELCFHLHHIWPAEHIPVQFGEGTAGAGDLLQLSDDVWPQLSSQPLGRILFPGETECRVEEERTCSFFSLSPGLNYDFPSKYEPGETA